jgi:threonine dehydratase
MPQAVGLEEVRHAREIIGRRLVRTPLLSSTTLGKLVGAEVHLKAELFQKTGSFKPRGVLNKLAQLTPAERERGVIGLSSGNHAQALAYGAALEGLDALIVMWEGASPQKVFGTLSYGATVDAISQNVVEAFERLQELLDETGRTLIHPFDDPAIVAGQGTVGLEIVEDLPKFDAVLVPVGGGGLVAGITASVKALSPETRVIAVEPEHAAALHLSLISGEDVRITAPSSVADGLTSPYAGKIARELGEQHGIEHVTVTDDEIREATRFLYRFAKLAAEPSAAASVAAILSQKVKFGDGDQVVCVISGGNVYGPVAAEILAAVPD